MTFLKSFSSQMGCFHQEGRFRHLGTPSKKVKIWLERVSVHRQLLLIY